MLSGKARFLGPDGTDAYQGECVEEPRSQQCTITCRQCVEALQLHGCRHQLLRWCVGGGGRREEGGLREGAWKNNLTYRELLEQRLHLVHLLCRHQDDDPERVNVLLWDAIAAVAVPDNLRVSREPTHDAVR